MKKLRILLPRPPKRLLHVANCVANISCLLSNAIFFFVCFTFMLDSHSHFHFHFHFHLRLMGFALNFIARQMKCE